MIEENLTDRSFSKEDSADCSLSVQLNHSGLAYCVISKDVNRCVAFRKHIFENVLITEDLIGKTGEVLKNDEILNLKFHSVSFIGYTQQNTLIPESLFNVQNAGDYLSFNMAGDMDEDIFYNHIEAFGTYNVFALHRDVASLVSMHFEKIEFLSQSTTFIRYMSEQTSRLVSRSVYMSMNPDFIDVGIVTDGQLIYYNNFQYVNENDLLYYVMYVYDHHQLDMATVPLILSGEKSSMVSYIDLLQSNIPQTRINNAFGISKLASGLMSLKTSKYLNLISTIH